MLKDKNNNQITLSKNSKYWVSIALALIIILSFFCGFFTYRLTVSRNTTSLSWALEFIEKYGCYYDEKTGEIRKFSEQDFINMIMDNLDQYSAFFTKEEYRADVLSSEGNNFGVGISFGYDEENDCYYAFRVVYNSPAEKLGVKKGDRFVATIIDGERKELSRDFTVTDYFDSIPKDDELTFIIENEGGERELKIKRQLYIANNVKYFDKETSLIFSSDGGESLEKQIVNSGMSELDNDTAYISLYVFEGNISNGMATAMAYLKERGKTKLILDLRDNGGGFMTDLQRISAYLVNDVSDKTPVIAISRDKNGETEKFFGASNSFNEELEKIVVIANEHTASASECLIGAMLSYNSISQDTLVIEQHKDKNGAIKATTFGKGIMQMTFKNLLTGEAIKLTTARVYQPDGETCIHGKGITTTSENSVPKGQGLARAIAILGA